MPPLNRGLFETAINTSWKVLTAEFNSLIKIPICGSCAGINSLVFSRFSIIPAREVMDCSILEYNPPSASRISEIEAMEDSIFWYTDP
jgi:hypothetical protein